MRYFWVLLAVLFIWSASANIEAQINVSINIGSQPVWGPTGYDYAEYYFIPDIDVYYYVPLHRFYYYHNSRWIYSSYLPASYGNFDLYNCHKVVINERDPWKNNDRYRNEYSSFKGRHDQSPIRDSRDSKYFVNKNHPQHNTWVQQQKHGKGNTTIQNKGNIRPQRNPVIRPNNGNKGNTTIQKKGNVRPKINTVVRQNKGNNNVQNKGNKGNAGNKGNKKDNGKGKK